LLLAAAVLAGATVLRAQEPAPAAPPAPPPPAEAGVQPQDAGAAEDLPAGSGDAPPQADAGPAPSSPAAAEPSLPAADRQGGKVGPTRDRFEPTEKVRADFDVSFPVDI